MRLEEKLSKWAEHPEEDSDGDYGLIIDETVTERPSTASAPSISPLLPANIHPIHHSKSHTLDNLQRYVESADSDDYEDDLVLPEQAELLNRQLAQWKTPSYTRMTAAAGSMAEMSAEQTISMSGATVVDRGNSFNSIKTTDTVPSSIAPLRRQRKQRQQRNSSRLPLLIPSSHWPPEPMVVGSMRYDPGNRVWVGNEQEGERIANAIAESERQFNRMHSVPRSERQPIDRGKLARKISQRSGNPNLLSSLLLPEDTMAAASNNVATDSPALSPKLPRPATATTVVSSARSPPKSPALITPSTAIMNPSSANGGCCRNNGQRRTRPIFDPQNLQWIDPNEHKVDPFANIAALPLEPPSVLAIRQKKKTDGGRYRMIGGAPGAISAAAGTTDDNSGGGGGSCFTLTPEQMEACQKNSMEYDLFARHWFPRPPSA